MGDVCQFAAHQENGRLMGFVVEGRDWSEGDEEGKPSFSAFVFESNTEGEKVESLKLFKHEILDQPLYQCYVLTFLFYFLIHRYATPLVWQRILSKQRR